MGNQNGRENISGKAFEAYKALQQLHDAMKQDEVFKEYSHIVSNIESIIYTLHARADSGDIEETENTISLNDHTQKNLRQLANLCIEMRHHEYVAPSSGVARKEVLENSPEELEQKMMYRNPITSSIFTWVLSHPNKAVTWFEITAATEYRNFPIEYVSYYLEQLEDSGLIDKSVCERDGESITFYTLTDDGFDVADSIGVVDTAEFMHKVSESVDYGETWETYRQYNRPDYEYEWMKTPL